MSDQVQQAYEPEKPTDSDSMASPEEFVVRIRGLPWSATIEDVQKFFNGCRVKSEGDGIHFTYANDGRASGEAYIEFATVEDFNRALERNRCHMGKRYVEVFKSKRSEMDYVVKRTKQRSSKDSESVLRLRGLPYGCSKEEIAQFFTGYEIVPNGISLATERDGRSTGEAFVEFVNTDIAERALSKDKETIGHRYIEIFRAKKSDVHDVNLPKIRPLITHGSDSRPAPYDRRHGGRAMRGQAEDRYYRGRGRGYSRGYRRNDDDYPDYGRPHDDYNYDRDREEFEDRGYSSYREESYPGVNRWKVDEQERSRDFEPKVNFIRMRGLPFKVTEDDIVDFFDRIPLCNISIDYGDDGRATGEAVVEFYNYEDALAAMKKDRNRIKHRYIELFLNGSSELDMNVPPRENQRDYPGYDYNREREYDEDIRRDISYDKTSKWVDTRPQDTQSLPYAQGREYVGPDYRKDVETYDMWYGDGGSSKSNQIQEERYGDAVRIAEKKQFAYRENPNPGSKGGNYEESARSAYQPYAEDVISDRVGSSAIPNSVSRPSQEGYKSSYSSIRQSSAVNPQQQSISLSGHGTANTGGNRMPASGYQYSDDRSPRTAEMTAAVGYSQAQMRSASSNTIVARGTSSTPSQIDQQLQRNTSPPPRYASTGVGYGSYAKTPDSVNIAGGNRYTNMMGQQRANTSYSSNTYNRY